jgi:hypothetical protein
MNFNQKYIVVRNLQISLFWYLLGTAEYFHSLLNISVYFMPLWEWLLFIELDDVMANHKKSLKVKSKKIFFLQTEVKMTLPFCNVSLSCFLYQLGQEIYLIHNDHYNTCHQDRHSRVFKNKSVRHLWMSRNNAFWVPYSL